MSEFGTLNLEDLAVEEQRLSAEGGGKRDDIFITIPKPQKAGATSVFPVRILPPAKGEKLFQYTRLHMIKGHSVHCPKDLVPGKKGDPVWDYDTYCPICAYYNSLWRKADKLEEAGRKAEAEKVKDEARNIKPIERYYYNAIVRQEKDSKGQVQANVGPKILSIGKTVHKMIVRAIRGDKEAGLPPIGNVTDIKNGFDFIITTEVRGEDKFPNYDRSMFARESTPAGSPDEIKKWAAGLHDLKALRKPATVDQLELELARHLGRVDDEEEGFDMESLNAKYPDPTQRASRPAAVATTPVSDEDAVASVVGSMDVDVSADASDTVTAPAEDTSIDDDQFLEELQSMAEDD